MIHYTVQKGDALWKIAAAHNLTARDLIRANGAMLDDPNIIQPGLILHIPEPVVSEPEPDPEPEPPADGIPIRAGDNIAAILQAAAPGETFVVETGAVFPKVRINGLPDNITVYGEDWTFDGQGIEGPAITGTSDGVTIDGLTIRNYEGWVSANLSPGDRATQARVPWRALNASQMTNMTLRNVKVLDNDSGITIPNSGRMENCQAHRNKHLNLAGFQADGVRIINFKHSFANDQQWFARNWEASTKIVRSKNIHINGWEGRDCYGPGFWADGENEGFVVRNMTVERCHNGFFYELSAHPIDVDGLVARENDGAANIYISNSRGYADRPTLIKNFTSADHVHGREVVVNDQAHRSPRAGYVRLEDGTTPVITIREDSGTVPGIEVVNVVDESGNPVTARRVTV